jgi:acetyltransferase
LLDLSEKLNLPADDRGVLVSQMARSGVEVILGVTHDQALGPMVMFGSGGVTAELFGDIALRHCPIDEHTALEMIDETKCGKLLGGFRGGKSFDVAHVAHLLSRMSQVACGNSDGVVEYEINPYLVFPEGGVMLDARMQRIRKV